MAYFFIYYFIFAPLRHFPITHGTLWHMHISITSTKNNVNILFVLLGDCNVQRNSHLTNVEAIKID